MILAIAASNNWVIKSTDIKSAFLQGQPMEREVFLKPPKESDTQSGHLWKLRRCLYGLNDAARQFYNSLAKTLLEIGCIRNSLDPALFSVILDGKLVGALVSHVDDFLHAGNEYFDTQVMEKLYKRFLAGSKQDAVFVYTGYNITQSSDFSVILDQHDYVDNVIVDKIAAGDKHDVLSSKEKTTYRSLVGKLGWLVQGTRPDLAFQWLECSTKNKTATAEDLLCVGKKVLSAKVSRSSIVFQNLGKVSNWKIVVYSDAAFANLCGGESSTGGTVIFLVGENQKCCPLLWKTSKIRRVCRSSAAAEGMSLSEGLDEAIYLRLLLCQLLGVAKDVIKVLAYTDHEGLRTNISNVLHPNVSDKRLKIEISSIRQNLRSGEVNDIIWCSSQQQLADCLTKRGASGTNLLKVLQTGVLPVYQ